MGFVAAAPLARTLWREQRHEQSELSVCQIPACHTHTSEHTGMFTTAGELPQVQDATQRASRTICRTDPRLLRRRDWHRDRARYAEA